MTLKNTGVDLTHSVITVNNGNYLDLYKATIRERDYFDKDSVADFVTNLVFSTNKNLKISREIYKKSVLRSILCNFDIHKVELFTKIYLN